MSNPKDKSGPKNTLNINSTEKSVLGSLRDTSSPENETYRGLLSDDVTENRVVLDDMGGITRTTILHTPGRNGEIERKSRYPAESLVASRRITASSEPQITSLPSHPPPLQSSPPSSCTVLKVETVTHHALSVPSVWYAILDFPSDTNSPENMTYQALLSDDATKNSIALHGMGGVGKTTIVCALGRNDEIRDKFSDGVFFFRLGHDITMPSFIRQLQRLVKCALPEFLEDFKEMAADEDSYRVMITELTNLLVQKRFLLLFDDVWDTNLSVYQAVHAMCKAVRGNKKTSMKVLSSTRSRNVADTVALNSCTPINPEDYDATKCREIFCSTAGISKSDVLSLPARSHKALGYILKTCGGLPLALSIAGSGVKQLMDPSTDQCDLNVISEYWDLLEPNTVQLAEPEIGDGHNGLESALKTSLQFVEKQWESKRKTAKLDYELSAGEMLESLCIMQKQMFLPASVIKKLWGVREVEDGVRMLSRNSLVSEVRKGSKIVGVRVHDLVLDMSMKMAESGDRATKWHTRLLDRYRASLNTSPGAEVSDEDEGVEWWNVDSNDKYIVDNVVRHLLGAGQATEALRLLIDYRWVERVNDNKNRAPFQKVISDLKLLQSYIVDHQKTETGKETTDIDILVKAMGLCMVPYCIKNPEECAFQLFGRLRDVRSESGIVERLVRSVVQYGRRPWALSGPNVLTSGTSLLRRVLDLENSGMSMCVGAGREEVVVGGCNGNVWVYNGREGTKKMSLIGHGEEDDIIDMYFDNSSRMVYSCSSRGRVVVWKEYKISHSFQAEGLQNYERIQCMQVLPRRGRVVLGTSKGRLVVIDVESGSTIRNIYAHDGSISSLTAGRREDVVVSGSYDRTIRVWGAEKFNDTENVLDVGNDLVNSVTLSGDGRLLESGWSDGSVQMFDMERRERLWSRCDERQDWVTCVLFSEDAKLLYAAGRDGAIFVRRLSNSAENVGLVHTLRHSKMTDIRSMCMRDGSELFALNWGQVYVWDARDINTQGQLRYDLQQRVDEFVFSADEAAMLTLNPSWKELVIYDIPNETNLCRRDIPRVPVLISDFPDFENCPRVFAVSNDRNFVAFAKTSSCVVHIYDRGGKLLYPLSDVEQSALASIDNQQGNSTSVGASGGSHDSESGKPDAKIDSLWFSPDGSIVFAVAEVEISGEDSESTWMKSKPISWDVRSGAVLSESQVGSETNASNGIAGSRRNYEERSSSLSVNRRGVVTCEHDGKCFTVATLEHEVSCWHYCHDTFRLWFTKWGGGLFYIDFVTDNNHLQLPNEPPSLPPLPQLHPPPSEDATKYTDGDMDTEAEKCNIFISYAGPDKWTFAKSIYYRLVRLGLKVFLDLTELRPGQHAPQKMIDAMQTAKNDVVILSPEFVAKKRTMKELMCFPERFSADGERRVIIIPVFYRLKLEECRDENSLFSIVNENGENVFITEGFLERMARQNEYDIRDVVEALQMMRSLTGIENREGVTNSTSVEEKEKQIAFAMSISAAILEARTRLESGRAAGPSG